MREEDKECNFKMQKGIRLEMSLKFPKPSSFFIIMDGYVMMELDSFRQKKKCLLRQSYIKK